MIQGIGSAGILSAMQSARGAAGQGAGPRLAVVGRQFTNAEGQNLLDIQDQIRDTVTSTLQDGGRRSDVKSAVSAVLEDHGFDADAVMSALMSARPGARGFARGGGFPTFQAGADASASVVSSLFASLPAGSIVSTKA
ncbi:MAG: hypothetical protein AAF602_12935 [Myxococcota bacterium]